MEAVIFVAAVNIAYYGFGISLSSLFSRFFQRAIVIGLHRIEIDDKVINSADASALRESLEKQCAGLTSNHKNGDLTAEESLVLSLLQHYTKCYWINSLDYAPLVVTKGLEWLDESAWNKFRTKLDCPESSAISSKQVGELLRRFHNFWLQQSTKSCEPQIICFGLGKVIKLSLVTNNPSPSSTPSTYYLWYDRNLKCFEAITCQSNFYQDTTLYWEYLMLRSETCFDQFFQREFTDLTNEKLESRFNQLNDEFKLIGNTFDCFKRQFDIWKIGDEFHHILLDMGSCMESPDEESKDSTSAWCQQLWQVTARCFARQIEQAYIDQKRKIEMKRRETNSEIEKIRENVQQLNLEIAKARQRINAINKRAADEDKLLEKLAWNQLLLDLADPTFVPSYESACQRKNHDIYKEKNVCMLVVKIFDLIHPSSTTENKEKRSSLDKYVKNQSTQIQMLKELLSALDNFIGQEISNGITRNQVLTIDGEASVVLKKIASSVKVDNCQEIVINAERVIYVDCDWQVPGINVTLSAPLIKVISPPGVGKRTITTSGRNGHEHEDVKADDGNGVGGSGSHGLAGKDGGDAGDVSIDCQNFIGRLKIVARGGKGTDGQHGGDGQPGLKGSDGCDGTFPSDPQEGYNWYTLGDVRGITKDFHKNCGWPGKPGGNGGSGGNGGTAGRGGFGGQLHFLSSNDFTQFIEHDDANGMDGNDGQPGRGSDGGSGGKHGSDAFVYFEPNDSRPIIWNTGHWRRHKGSETDLEVVKWRGHGITIGYKICNNSSRMGRAVDGQRGTEGKKASNHLQQRHRSSNSTATTCRSHNQGTRADEYERERERQLETRRRDKKQRANEDKFIHRTTRDIVGKENAISLHEEELVADQQRLKQMDESRQRVLSKIQETFEQRIVHQSAVGQRITRQLKLNFDDENNLGLSASSVPIDLGRDIRSGRPSPEKSTAALCCLVEVDAFLMLTTSNNNNLLKLKIPQTVQSFVLQLSLDEHENEWNCIEKIVRQTSETSDPLKLADSLEFIESNLPLVLSLSDQSPVSDNLIEILQTFLTSTGHDAPAGKDVISVLHEFHQRPMTVQQVIALLTCLTDSTHQSHILLSLFLDKWLLSAITKTLSEVFSEEGASRTSLFTNVWLQCSPLLSKWTNSSVLSLDAENKWFNRVEEFVSQLEELRHGNRNEVFELLMRFVRDRLGITQRLSEIDVDKKWQLVFIAQHLPTVDELDAIGCWARNKCDVHLMAIAERAFNEKFIAPLWSEIQLIIEKNNWVDDTTILEAIHRLNKASLSSFTDFSFKRRLQLGYDLKSKLEGADLKKKQFSEWIRPLSQQVQATTAELFVSMESDQVKIILSLAAPKKLEKNNAMLELNYRLNNLSVSFEPSQIVKLARILLDKSSDPSFTDNFNRFHWHCFRSTFLENWTNYFFSYWSKCYQQTELVRDEIVRKNPADGIVTILQLALERYLLFTSSLPPLEAVEKWLQLQKQSMPQDCIKLITDDLIKEVKNIISAITPTIRRLYLNKLLDNNNSEPHVGTDIVSLTDNLFEIISGTTVSFFNDAESVRSLLDVIEAAQTVMDLTNDDHANTSSQLISSSKLNEWKKKFGQWKVLDCEAASMVHLSVKQLVNSAEFKSSSDDDSNRKIYDQIKTQRQEMLYTFNEAISWLDKFVGYLDDSRSGIDTLAIIKATVRSSQFLSLNALKNGKTSLLQMAIDILMDCSSSFKQPTENSWSSFFGAILKLKPSEKTVWLIAKLTNFIGAQLINDRKRATWREVKCWFDGLDSLINATADGQDNSYWEEMMVIQQVLIDYCSTCYETKLLADHEKRSKLNMNLVSFTFKNAVERWTNIVRFVRPNKNLISSSYGQTEFLKDQLEIRQLVLKGLIQLGHSNSFYWGEENVTTFFKDFLFQEHESSQDKIFVLAEMLSGTRKAFLERWISLESCREPERIRDLARALRDKTCSLNDAQLLFSIVGYDIFTEEEKSYVHLIDDESAVESALLVDGQHPSSFLTALQKLAIGRIRAEFVRCFEPSITDRNIERYLPHPNKIQEVLPDKLHIRQLCRSFHRLIRIKKEEGDQLRDWLLWIRDVIVPSLKSYEAHQGLSVQQITKFFEDVEEFPLDLCRAVTTGCRPHQWVDFLAIFAIENLVDQLTGKCREDVISFNSIIQQLFKWWPTSGAPASFMHIFYRKIRQEMAGDSLQLLKLVQELTNQLTALNLQSIQDGDDFILGGFSKAPLIDWPLVIRFAQLVVDWTPELALCLTTVLDVQFGSKRTDQLLRLFVKRHQGIKDKSDYFNLLKNIPQNLIRYPWIKDQWIALIDGSLKKSSFEVKESDWDSLFDSGNIEMEMKKSSQVDLSVEDILTIMSRDSESIQVIGNSSKMARRIDCIWQKYYKRKPILFRRFNIKDWTQKIKEQSSKLEVDDFLAVACLAVHNEKGYVPRDVQLVAVVSFISSDQENGRRMGQISTGEGKTLISAILAIYHVLSHWNEDRHVNIITSSSVLAEANIAEIGWLFKAFGVSVSNNCDQKCTNDDAVRRERYNNDVIYGDLGSFMRDILLTRFFEDKDVTRNRNPGAIIVDEVDSMTLDKGENVLYMSHNIPEMYDLMRLFVQIWTLVNAPDVVHLAQSGDIVGEVRQLIEPMIPTCVPNGLKNFAERHLSTWIKSAFRAAYLLQPNDAYKVDDCDDGQGRRIVIMDKETGVEQVQTEWSDGLQQFLQLKHGMKWTPISLKAIFMSNIGYFSEFKGRMYGLTGTLGSAAECDLLRQVFGVDFFRLPRFRPRFCVQHDPIIAHDRKNWLQQLQQTIVSLVSTKDKQRSVLVVCENIESADSIYDLLKSTKSDDQFKVLKYVSSFDEDFKKHQHEEIRPGQVIIATNLAGRGTDLKPNKELLINGGLHVIIGFMPPNARVEAQAEGRTARCGQPGSFQFVIEKENGQGNIAANPYVGQLLELKSKRDDDERLRLDNIRRESLPKIQMEEKLFHEFYEKCIRPLSSSQLFTKAINLEHLQKQEKLIKRNCLNNRWALWLDENVGLIEKAHRDPLLEAELNNNFDRLTMSVQSPDVKSIVSSPSERMMLARHYEESSLTTLAAKCYQQVTEKEPQWCENALLDRARLVLAESAGYNEKVIAKGYLKRARKLIDDRIDVLTGLTQQVDQCLSRQMEKGSALCHKRFEEQVTNHIRLWRIHSARIDNLVGVSLKSALAAVLPIEEDQHIDKVIDSLGKCNFMKSRRYSKKNEKKTFDWPPFVVHCREPLTGLVQKKNCKLSDIEDAIGKVEQNLWKSLISVYIDEGKEYGERKIIEGDQYIGDLPDAIVTKGFRRILPGWLKYHDGQDFSLVSSTLGIEKSDQLKKLEKWLEDKKLLKVADKCFRHRILKPIPSMEQDTDVQLVKGVALSSCADVVTTWFSSPITEPNGNRYVLRPLFDERKKKLAQQFGDYLVDVGIVKDPSIRFLSASNERSRDDIKKDLDDIKSRINRLDGLGNLAELFYSKEEETLTKKKENLSAALGQAVEIHLGQLKTLSQVKSSFHSLWAALPPSGDDQSSPIDEVQQFNNQHLDRVLTVEEYVSRWDWRVGVVALIGVAQLVGAMAFPFFSAGLVGEGINDLMFAFQCLQSPGSFTLKSYLVDKGKSLALTAVTMGLGAARLVKACGGSFKQAGKLMCRFNGTLKAWWQAGKHILHQCANMISSSIVGQVVSRFLTWLNKFIMEQVLERIKSFLFNNSFLRSAFTNLKDLMRTLMNAIVKSGKSVAEASKNIKEALDRTKNQLAEGDWATELRTNASSITSRMMRIFNESSASLSNLQSNYVGEYRSHATTGNTRGITAGVNAGTIEKAIAVGSTIVDYGKKAAEVTEKISQLTTTSQTVMKLATHGSTYVGDLNAALQKELTALKMKNQKEELKGGELSKAEKERFDKFVDETEGEIQSSIMKEALDTIQSTWLQPMIQVKVEGYVSKIGSKLVQKYCPSILPEGFDKPKDQNGKSGDEDQIQHDDKWIDDMGNGKPAGPVEMQNSVDACGYVLEINDETGEYTKGSEGNKFNYYPEGNPYSDKPVVKMSFTQNEDGTKHVQLIMPDGTKHDYVPDPSEPPNRCFFGALSKAQKHPSVDHTINVLKEHAKGNDRARFMNKLGVNESYQHLKVGAYRQVIDGNTTYKKDKYGRVVEVITTETKRKQMRNEDPGKVKEIKENLGFIEGDTYGHIIALCSGGVDREENISRQTAETNRYLYREHEKNFEKVRNEIEPGKDITRVIKIHYQHTVSEITRMRNEGRNPDLYKVNCFQYDFYTGERDNPINLYKSGPISNWNSQQASRFFEGNPDPRTMKRLNAARKTSNEPWHVSGPNFPNILRKW